jgi:Rrf2 family protein
MLSQKARYALRAIQHLAGTWSEPGLTPLAEIAAAQNIPPKFLTVILSELGREGLVVSSRGRDGGYRLARPPADMTYGDVVRVVRGSLALVPCASRLAYRPCERCVPESQCQLRRIMLRVRDETAAVLDRITLADPACEPPVPLR